MKPKAVTQLMSDPAHHDLWPGAFISHLGHKRRPDGVYVPGGAAPIAPTPPSLPSAISIAVGSVYPVDKAWSMRFDDVVLDEAPSEIAPAPDQDAAPPSPR